MAASPTCTGRAHSTPLFLFPSVSAHLFFFPAVWQIIHFSTGVLPLIPQTSTPSYRSDNRIVSVQSISGVSLISYGNRASICWKLILGCDIVLIAILSPDAATQTNLVFGGSERTRPPDNAKHKYIEGPSVCRSPTLYPLLSLTFTNTAMILKSLTFQAGTPRTPTYRHTLPFYKPACPCERSEAPSEEVAELSGDYRRWLRVSSPPFRPRVITSTLQSLVNRPVNRT